MKLRKEVLVLPIKDVVRSDYHEYITRVRAYNFTLPEGDFVFSMRDRGEKVALSGRPLTPSNAQALSP